MWRRVGRRILLQTHTVQKATIVTILIFIVAAQFGEIFQILHARQIAIKHDGFRNIGEEFFGLYGILCDIHIIDLGLTGCGVDEIQKQIDGGGFPSAIGSQQTIDVTTVDRQIEGL